MQINTLYSQVYVTGTALKLKKLRESQWWCDLLQYSPILLCSFSALREKEAERYISV